MSHPTCHLLSLLSQKPGSPSSASACSPPRVSWPPGCSLPPRLALASAEGLASSGLEWCLCVLAPWWGLGASLAAASAHGRPLSLSGKPRHPRASAPPARYGHCPAWPGLASDTVPDTTGSGSGWAGLGWGQLAEGLVVRPYTCSLEEPWLHLEVTGSHFGQSLTAQVCGGSSSPFSSNTPGSPLSLTSQYGRYIIQIAQRYPSC